MVISERIFKHENINGVMLSLKVDSANGSQNSRSFTISFQNSEGTSAWAKLSLFFAILFNIFAVTYVKIGLTVMVVIFVSFSSLIFYWITHSVQSESLLVIPTVGIHSSVKYVCGKEEKFVPWAFLDDVIINEAISFTRTLFYLTLIVRSNPQIGEKKGIKLMSMFKNTKPRLEMLEEVYNEIQSLLVNSQRKEKGSGDVGDTQTQNDTLTNT